jgi:tRNA(fMet)-specific endonuclease VapC
VVKYLLDTNILVEPMRPRPNAKLLRTLLRHEAEVSISAITVHEIAWGVARMPLGRRRTTYEGYVSAVTATTPVLPYDGDAARIHARERARLDAAGTPVPYEDGQIAGIALSLGLVLVTNNVKDFERFVGLSVENWMR